MVAFHYAPARDGLARQTHLLGRTLAAQGLSVTVITQRLAGTSSQQMLDGVDVVRVPVPYFGGFRTRAYPFLIGLGAFLLRHRDDFDVIHAHQALQPAALAVALSRVMGKPCIVKVAGGGHSGNVAYLRRWWPSGALSLRALREATRVISLSPEISAELERENIPRDRIVMMPNGVDIRRFIAARSSPRAGHVMTAARLSHEKGIDLLIAAWPTVMARNPDARLTILGAGPEAAALAAQARGLGVADSVDMPGEVEDVIPYLARSIFVLPSHFGEGMSNAVLEAMAAACPVLVSDCVPNTHIVEHDVTGWAFRRGDADDLAAKLCTLLADPARAASLGARAASEVDAHYSIDQVAGRYRELYREICS